MQSQTTNRSVWACVHCSSMGALYTNRRDRVVGHILKHHTPLDEAPFYCRLCMLRCMTKDQLLKHCAANDRHINMSIEKKVTDPREFLHKSQKPKRMTDKDLMQLSKEQVERLSLNRRTQNNLDFLDSDSDLEDAEEGRPLTQTVAPSNLYVSLQSQIPVAPFMPASQTMVQGVQHPSHLVKTPPVQANRPQGNTIEAPMVQTSVPLTLQRTPQATNMHADQTRAPSDGNWVVPKPTRVLQPQAIPQATLLSMPTLDSLIASPVIAVQAPATSPVMPVSSPMRTPATTAATASSTPVRDEAQINILSDILSAGEVAEVLAWEESVSTGSSAKPKTTQERGTSPPPTKRSRKDDSVETPVVDLSPVVRAMQESTRALVDAIDRNSRAVRCQATTVEALAKEMKEMTRLLRARQRKETDERQERSRSPKVKSAVHIPGRR